MSATVVVKIMDPEYIAGETVKGTVTAFVDQVPGGYPRYGAVVSRCFVWSHIEANTYVLAVQESRNNRL